MTIEDKIRDEKLQSDINWEAAKISALSSGKIGKHEYLTGEEILPSNQSQKREQAKFTNSPLGKVLEKKTKKHVNALKSLNLSNKIDEITQTESVFPQNQFNDLIIDKRNKIKQSQNNISLDGLEYTT